jgi:hypothetical protein
MQLTCLPVTLIPLAGHGVKYNVIESDDLHRVLRLQSVVTPGNLMQMVV